jgi:large-conductance mechanosensitive channel
MDRKTVEQLASLEVDLINRIWGCVSEEEDTFEAISRQLVENPKDVDLQNFINHALTGVLLAVAFFRFKETMKPFMEQKEIEEAFMRMTHNKAKNVVDHWHERPEDTAE